MELLIAGDLVPTQSNIDLFSKAEIVKLIGKELYLIWNNADYRILNLEVPLSDEKNPIKKFGPNLIASPSSINGIKALRPDLISLANNHILDQGEQGLLSTMKLLNSSSIPFVGVGKNSTAAAEPYIIEEQGLKIGIYSCTEHEFSIAGNYSSGANLFDPFESLDHIQNLKTKCNFVIVIYHGGKEHYRYPSPYLRKVSRKMVEKGADLVVCQHSHCIGSFERYLNSTIVYGQGNFIYDDSNNDFWKTSLLIKADFADELIISFIPFTKERNVIRIADKHLAEEILDGFLSRSEDILREGFIDKQFETFAKTNRINYLRKLSGSGKLFSEIDTKILNNYFINHKYNSKQLLAIQNYIECEAHREILLAVIKGGFEIGRE